MAKYASDEEEQGERKFKESPGCHIAYLFVPLFQPLLLSCELCGILNTSFSGCVDCAGLACLADLLLTCGHDT